MIFVQVGTREYQKACNQESAYWGLEAERAAARGIPFSADMRRGERIYVDRGKGLPQQQTFDPKAENIMNGWLYSLLFETCAKKLPAKILVLTCGAGGLSLELARLGHHVVGIDISEKAIKVAEKFAAANPFRDHFGRLEYQVADLNQKTFNARSFDIVIAWDGLHHILKQQRLMQEINRALKKDGLFIFSDNIGMHWFSRLVGGGLYFVLPTFVSYTDKLKIALGGEKRIKKDMTARSPFEEINTEGLVEVARQYFEILDYREHTGIGYRAAISGDVRLAARLKYYFLKKLKQLDDWGVKTRILKGDHAFVIGRPKNIKSRSI